MVSYSRGFSYVEVLISFLILSSGALTYAVLITRIQLMQIDSIQSLDAVFMANYMVSQLALSAEQCQISSNSCPSVLVDLGHFDATSPLLEGYGWTVLEQSSSSSPLGCIDFDRDSNTYVIGIFNRGFNFSELNNINCKQDDFLSVVRYTPLSVHKEILVE